MQEIEVNLDNTSEAVSWDWLANSGQPLISPTTQLNKQRKRTNSFTSAEFSWEMEAEPTTPAVYAADVRSGAAHRRLPSASPLASAAADASTAFPQSLPFPETPRARATEETKITVAASAPLKPTPVTLTPAVAASAPLTQAKLPLPAASPLTLSALTSLPAAPSTLTQAALASLAAAPLSAPASTSASVPALDTSAVGDLQKALMQIQFSLLNQLQYSAALVMQAQQQASSPSSAASISAPTLTALASGSSPSLTDAFSSISAATHTLTPSVDMSIEEKRAPVASSASVPVPSALNTLSTLSSLAQSLPMAYSPPNKRARLDTDASRFIRPVPLSIDVESQVKSEHAHMDTSSPSDSDGHSDAHFSPSSASDSDSDGHSTPSQTPKRLAKQPVKRGRKRRSPDNDRGDLVCKICNTSFCKPFTLNRHMKRHTGERPFACAEPGCGKTFAEKSTLIRHTMTHTGERPYKCDWPGCTKTFADRTNIKRHMSVHTGNKPFRCPSAKCLRGFASEDELRAHAAKSHSSDPECTHLIADC